MTQCRVFNSCAASVAILIQNFVHSEISEPLSDSHELWCRYLWCPEDLSYWLGWSPDFSSSTSECDICASEWNVSTITGHISIRRRILALAFSVAQRTAVLSTASQRHRPPLCLSYCFGFKLVRAMREFLLPLDKQCNAWKWNESMYNPPKLELGWCVRTVM